MRRYLPLLLLPLLLCSCAGQQTPADILAPVRSFAVADVQEALATAKANNDQEGMLCYAGLLDVLNAGLPPVGQVKGAVSAFESGRVVVTAATTQSGAVAKQINLACAPLFLDAQATLVKIGLKFTPVPIPK